VCLKCPPPPATSPHLISPSVVPCPAPSQGHWRLRAQPDDSPAPCRHGRQHPPAHHRPQGGGAPGRAVAGPAPRVRRGLVDRARRLAAGPPGNGMHTAPCSHGCRRPLSVKAIIGPVAGLDWTGAPTLPTNTPRLPAMAALNTLPALTFSHPVRSSWSSCRLRWGSPTKPRPLAWLRAPASFFGRCSARWGQAGCMYVRVVTCVPAPRPPIFWVGHAPHPWAATPLLPCDAAGHAVGGGTRNPLPR
jgi:hypothetical protein